MIGYMRISKREFYRSGGFANSNNVRVMRGKGSWKYYRRID